MTTQQPGVALVTGAAGGIGLAIARSLAAAGYRVFGTSRKAGATGAPGVTMLPCDVTDETSVATLVQEVLRQAGSIDLLVNNAGGALIAAAEESSVEQAKALFDLNLFGIVRMTNAVLPILRQQGGGRIINISSVVGFLPSPFAAFYAASKHAVEGYSQSLDHEVRPFGIRVLLVEPAFTRTDIDSHAALPDRPLDAYAAARQAMQAVWAGGIALGDAPEIVATAVLEVARAPRPRLRTPAGKAARTLSLLRRFVPANAFDKSLRKQMQLPA